MTISTGSAAGPVARAGSTTPAAPRILVAPGRRRTMVILASVILAVTASILAIVLLVPRQVTSYPAGSAEAAFQQYLAAWEARDLETAYAAFSNRIRSQVTLDQFRAMERDFGWSREEDRRVVLVGATVEGDTGRLDLRVEQVASGGLFGADTWSWNTSVALVREEGTWHVDEYLAGLEPMPLEKW